MNQRVVKRMTRLYRRAGVTVAFALLACSDSTAPNNGTDPAPTFVVEVSGEEFRVRVATAAQAAALRARMRTGTRGVIQGTLVAGNGGFNGPWAWHLDASTVAAPDLAIELCDGRPSMVDADLGYWMGTVRVFCPWGARVVREELAAPGPRNRRREGFLPLVIPEHHTAHLAADCIGMHFARYRPLAGGRRANARSAWPVWRFGGENHGGQKWQTGRPDGHIPARARWTQGGRAAT
ncbi:MAG: BP74-related protein [Gemmatimonadaceae bacterium]